MIAVLKTDLPDTLPLEQIRIDGGTQPRSAVNAEYIQELADCLNAGSILPAVTVFYDGESYWLADGFHRYHAHRRTEQIDIAVEIRSGTQRDAVLFSVGANASHGLRRTNEDKRRAVLRLLEDPDWKEWPDSKIAEACAVGRHFVRKVRGELTCTRSTSESQSPALRKYIDKHGNESWMNVSRIGKTSSRKRGFDGDALALLNCVPSNSSVVYLVCDQVRCKIGFSESPENRIATLLHQNPSASLKAIAQGTMADEQKVHKLLECERDAGEWFVANHITCIEAMYEAGLTAYFIEEDINGAFPTIPTNPTVTEEQEDKEPQPAQRYAVALFRRPDLTEAERTLRNKYEYCIHEVATGEVVPTWEDLRSLYEQFGAWLNNQEAQEQGVIAFGAQSQLKYVVSRPDLNTSKDFPIRLFSPEQAWRFYQNERDRYLGLLENKPTSDEFTVLVEPDVIPKSERVENDYYPTHEALTKPLIHLGCIRGQVFESCAGSGDIARLFDGCISNELYPRPEFEPDLIGDASDPKLWAELDRMGGTDWTVTNPPYGMELPTKILELAAQHSREGVAMLLRLGFIEPCQDRRELLQRLSDNLRYFIPVNPRPQFRGDTSKTDSITVAWFVWDFTWSWEDQGIDCPFKFITDWRSA